MGRVIYSGDSKLITDLSTGFLSAIRAQKRQPVQLCHFHYNGKMYLLSDAPVGAADGLKYNYSPVIESWGTIQDSSYLNSSFSGESLEIKSMQLTIIIDADSKDLLVDALTNGLDNSIVEIYQWFHDTPNDAPQLIDIMLVQDPIEFSEKSSLLSLDLVSIVMKNNPYLWPREPGEETRDIVVGKMINMPLYDQQTSRVSALSQDIAYDYTGEVFIDNGVGFRAGTDTMTIDSEIITYSWISASAMNITARGSGGTTARPHIRGALICHPDAVFDYAICAGPVTLVDNLEGNGEAYTQPVTFFPGQDPVIARFTSRPPWLKVSPGAGGPAITPDEETSTQYGVSTESDYGDGGSSPSSPGSINSSSGSATMSISNTVGGGPGSTVIDSQSVSYTNTNLTPYTNTKLYLVAGPGMRTVANTAGYFTQDGVVASINRTYGWDSSAYGNLTSLTIDVAFGDCKLYYADGTIEVIFVDSDGIEHILDSETVLAYETGTVFGVNFNFRNKTKNYNVISYVSNFAELSSCVVKVRYTNIRTQTTVISTQYARVVYSYVHWNIGYFTPVGTVLVPWSELASHFNRDLSALGGLTDIEINVRFNLSVSNAEVYQAIIQRSTSNPSNDSILWSRNVSSSKAAATVNLSPTIASFSALKDTRIGVYQQVVGPGTEGTVRQCSTSFEYVQWVLTYQPGQIETPDEERVVYAEDLICDVTSTLGADPTPAEVIQHLIEDHSTNGPYVNTDMFEERRLEYVADSYYFNGVLAGDIRLHAALKQCLGEGLARFLFTEGSIGLLNYSTYESATVDYSMADDQSEYFIRSKSQKNQPTSSVINDSTVMYDYNPALIEFDSKRQDTDDESILSYDRHEARKELTLIRSDNIAQKISESVLFHLSKPITVLSFDMFMSGYVLQKGDRILFHTVVEGFKAVGHVASIDRVIGQGKNKVINKFIIKIADSTSTTKVLDLADYMSLVDNNLSLGGIIKLTISDDIVVNDTYISKQLKLGLLDQVVVNDISIISYTTKGLVLSDQIVLDDSEAFLTKAVNLVLADIVKTGDSELNKSTKLGLIDQVVMDNSSIDPSTNKRLKIEEQIIVDDTDYLQTRAIHLQLAETVWIDDSGVTITAYSGYGVEGFGDKPYGD
jgi:hypothetical protein